MREWTDAQREAFTKRGGSLLVSAAAGSGKTAVLVERIIRLVTEEKKDVDRILVVTFTRAAASQMKERIAKALEELLEAHPEDEHLQRQSSLVHHASISTIDSFCLDVVREYIHLTELEPDFRMADQGEMALLGQDVLTKLLEDKYAQQDPAFLNLVDNFEPEKREGSLGENVLALYRYSQAYPYPARWRRHAVSLYDADTPEKLEQQAWIKSITDYIRTLAREEALQLNALLETVGDNELNPEKGYKTVLRDDLIYLERIAAAQSYEALFRAAAVRGRSDWAALRSVKGDDKAQLEQAKMLRSEIKKQFADKIPGTYLFMSVEELADFVSRCAPYAQALVDLTDEYEERFARAKRDKNTADFSDIEHEALNILWESRDGAEGPTDAAASYAQRFDEIMIDEYQDSNLVQETLLSAISREHHGGIPNRFMVGDVKQSIYRFRQAMPELFMEKYDSYRKTHVQAGSCIELSSNFRSRSHILEGVNMLFRQLMQPDIGGVVYDEHAALYPGAKFPERDDDSFCSNEIWIVDTDCVDQSDEQCAEDKEEDSSHPDAPAQMPDSETAAEELSDDEREAAVIGQAVLEMVGRETILDEHTQQYRPVKFSDIAVLQRSLAGHSDVYMRVFGAMGIPVYTDSGSGYFSTGEVRIVLDYLTIVDNPLQNIPMAAVLRSPFGRFTDEEIAAIYLSGKEYFIWEKMQRLAQEGGSGKITAFVRRLEMLRGQMRELPLQELLWRILEGTHFLDYVSAMPSGEQRRANLDMLVEKAALFDKGSYSGLFQFLRYVEHLRSYEIDYGEAPVGMSGEGSVHLMTIHKSKGLEFPIVFVAGLGRRFNTREASGSLIIHGDLGLGIDMIDPQRHVKITSPAAGAIGRRALMDARGEELRVLYVALTRAKEKLILVGSAGKKEREKWYSAAVGDKESLSFTVRAEAANPLHLVMAGALRHISANAFRQTEGCGEADPSSAVYRDGCGFQLRLVPAKAADEEFREDEMRQEEERYSEIDPAREYDPETAARLSDVLNRSYPWEDKAMIPGKVSVSYLKAEQYEKEQERIYQLLEDRDEQSLPAVKINEAAPEGSDPAGRDEGVQRSESHALMGAAARGSLIHQYMQYIDYGMVRRGEEPAGQLEWMIKCGKIADSKREVLSDHLFAAYYDSVLCQRMADADRRHMLFREQPFVLGETARKIKSEWDSDDTVLIQGIIDAWFIEEDEIVVLDYKTDRVPDGDAGSLVRKYKTQLDLYAGALERITQKKVKEKLIWSFALDRQIEV